MGFVVNYPPVTTVTVDETTNEVVVAAAGPRGPQGEQGEQGDPGAAASVAVGSTTTGAAGSDASVANSGTSSAAVLDFTIPRGDTGAQGIQGEKGDQGDPGVVAATAPITYDSGTQTVALDESGIEVAQSQVTDLVDDLAALTNAGTEYRQFGADGSLLQNLPTRVHPGEQLLKQAVWWIDSAHSSADQQSVQNLGWGGSALNAQLGSTSSADSNDPKFLPWEGENYVYLPGVDGNYLSVPDEAALDITGDIDIRAKVAADDWTPGSFMSLVSKYNPQTNLRSYMLRLNNTGTLSLFFSPDGSTFSVIQSSAIVGATDGASKWVRATLDVDNGASGHDAKFYLSDDGVTWSQLGSTITTAGTTSIHSSATNVFVGSYANGTGWQVAGKVHRAQILDGIDGTPVLDVDTSQVTSGSDTSFTALTGQTVSINRSTSGRKSVAVTHPVWLFGTDDYMEVSDNALLDFGASDSFTVLAVVRQWATPASNGRILRKLDSSNIGWSVAQDSTSVQWRVLVADGTNFPNTATPAGSAGVLATITGVRNVSSNSVVGYLNDVAASSVTDTTTGTLANAAPMRVGRDSTGTSYQDFEFIAAAVFRKALTAGEITTLTNYFQGRAA